MSDNKTNLKKAVYLFMKPKPLKIIGFPKTFEVQIYVIFTLIYNQKFDNIPSYFYKIKQLD